jgi:TrmH family RNA methyltransferase
MNLITSRDNPLLKELRRLSQDTTAYRKLGKAWLEGDHLCGAALARGVKPEHAVFAESQWLVAPKVWQEAATRISVVPDALFDDISGLESPGRMGFVMALPESSHVQAQAATVVLDRVQDAGNVGSILRSAAAFGFTQVVALKGTAALWSPKVLRAGMGAHFGLHLVDGVAPEALKALTVPWLTTDVHQGAWLHELAEQRQLPMPCAWILGHEGQGVSAELAAQARVAVRIAQPGGEESLNVAVAAAICLHASATSRLQVG